MSYPLGQILRSHFYLVDQVFLLLLRFIKGYLGIILPLQSILALQYQIKWSIHSGFGLKYLQSRFLSQGF